MQSRNPDRAVKLEHDLALLSEESISALDYLVSPLLRGEGDESSAQSAANGAKLMHADLEAAFLLERLAALPAGQRTFDNTDIVIDVSPFCQPLRCHLSPSELLGRLTSGQIFVVKTNPSLQPLWDFLDNNRVLLDSSTGRVQFKSLAAVQASLKSETKGKIPPLVFLAYLLRKKSADLFSDASAVLIFTPPTMLKSSIVYAFQALPVGMDVVLPSDLVLHQLKGLIDLLGRIGVPEDASRPHHEIGLENT